MKIKTKVFTAFLKKTRMEGTQMLPEAILKFEKDGLKINANSQPKQARVMSWLRTGAFQQYEELGSVGLNDLSTVVKVLDRFDEDINIKKEGNLLTISGGNKKVDIELVAESFLDTDSGEPKLVFDETLVVPATSLKSIFADVKLNKDAIMTLKTEEKKLKVSNTGKYKFVNEIEAPTCKGGITVKMGEPFIDVVTNLDGNLELSMKNDYPIKIMEKTENSIVTIIVAPRVEDEGEETSTEEPEEPKEEETKDEGVKSE